MSRAVVSTRMQHCSPAWAKLGVALAVALTLTMAWRFDFLVDDAFITFRYARHLSEGHGLVWNLGEKPPVEGFSNFLWVVLCALFESVGLAPEVGSRVVSVVSASWLTMLVARAVARRSAGSSEAAPGAALMFAALPPIATWATGGLETMSFATCVFGAFEALARPRHQASPLAAAVYAALAVLLRADGFVWTSIALASAALARANDARQERASAGSLPEALKPVAPAALAVLLATAAYVAWRLHYFGEWGPNTARVKVRIGMLALERGSLYVASLLLAVLSVPWALAGALWALRRDSTGLAAPALLFTAGASSYLALVGGDWMMMHRMLTPVLPFVALGFAAHLVRLRSPLARAASVASAIVLGLLPSFDVHPLPRSMRELAHFRWSQDYRTEYDVWRKGVVDIREWIAIGKALALHTQPGESMMLGNIGALGYYPENLIVYDTQGLTNKAPLVPASREGRSTAGHDFIVSPDVLEALQPTYWAGGRLVPSSDPFAPLPDSLSTVDAEGRKRPNEKGLERFDFVVAPLPNGAEFGENRSLLLLKYRR